MGTAIIAGLTFATFLTLVIVPVMYSIFDSLSARMQLLFGRDQEVDDISGDGVGARGNGTSGAPVERPVPQPTVS